jgi:hypothetical protein
VRHRPDPPDQDGADTTVEYIAAAYLDMAWHSLPGPVAHAARAFEQAEMDRIGRIPEIIPRYRSTYYSHIFDGGYSAGYHVPAGGGAGQGRVPGVQGGGRPVRSGHGRPAAEVHLVRGEYAAGAVRAAPRSRGSSARVHGKVAAVPPGVTPFAPPKPRTMSWRRSIRSRSARSRLSCC